MWHVSQRGVVGDTVNCSTTWTTYPRKWTHYKQIAMLCGTCGASLCNIIGNGWNVSQDDIMGVATKIWCIYDNKEKETKQTQNTLIMGFQSKSHPYLVLRLHVCQKLPVILECMQWFLTAVPKWQHALFAIREIQRRVLIFEWWKCACMGTEKRESSMFWQMLSALDIMSKLLTHSSDQQSIIRLLELEVIPVETNVVILSSKKYFFP
jgi:hypothetical protein